MFIQPDDDILDFDRSEALTAREFRRLARTPAGDIVDLSAIHPYLTDEQVLELTPDDAARVEEWSLEEASIFADDFVDFGIACRVTTHFDMSEAA